MLRSHDRMNALLALEDGTWYRGVAAGAQRRSARRSRVQHEHDRLSGSPDRSRPTPGQIVTMTAPQIGNYGVAPGDAESRGAARRRLRHAGSVADRQQLARRWHAPRLPRPQQHRRDRRHRYARADAACCARPGVMRGIIATGHGRSRRAGGEGARDSADGRRRSRPRRHLRRSVRLADAGPTPGESGTQPSSACAPQRPRVGRFASPPTTSA